LALIVIRVGETSANAGLTRVDIRPRHCLCNWCA